MDSGAALQEFLEFTLSQLVEHPDQASVVHELGDDGRHLFTVRLAEEDVGLVVGRKGFTISSIRSLLKAGAERHGIEVGLKVYQVGGERDGQLID